MIPIIHASSRPLSILLVFNIFYSTVFAQIASDAPLCVRSCHTNGYVASPCSTSTEHKCLCGSATYIDTFTSCVSRVCTTSSEKLEAQTNLRVQCQEEGVAVTATIPLVAVPTTTTRPSYSYSYSRRPSSYTYHYTVPNGSGGSSGSGSSSSSSSGGRRKRGGGSTTGLIIGGVVLGLGILAGIIGAIRKKNAKEKQQKLMAQKDAEAGGVPAGPIAVKPFPTDSYMSSEVTLLHPGSGYQQPMPPYQQPMPSYQQTMPPYRGPV